MVFDVEAWVELSGSGSGVVSPFWGVLSTHELCFRVTTYPGSGWRYGGGGWRERRRSNWIGLGAWRFGH